MRSITNVSHIGNCFALLGAVLLFEVFIYSRVTIWMLVALGDHLDPKVVFTIVRACALTICALFVRKKLACRAKLTVLPCVAIILLWRYLQMETIVLWSLKTFWRSTFPYLLPFAVFAMILMHSQIFKIEKTRKQ